MLENEPVQSIGKMSGSGENTDCLSRGLDEGSPFVDSEKLSL